MCFSLIFGGNYILEEMIEILMGNKIIESHYLKSIL